MGQDGDEPVDVDLQVTPSQNVLDDIFLKLGFLVTLLFSLKRVTLLQKSLPALYRQSGSVPS